MVEPINILKLAMSFVLCLFYSSWIGFGVLIAYIFKKDSDMWKVKDRPTPPRILTSSEFGEHKFAKVNGVKIHYVEKGDPKKPLMLFIHGFPEFWFSWRFQLKEFSKDYWTIAIDQRGYSDSDKPANASDYHVDNMVADIHQFVQQLGCQKFTLVGHDWGSLIGFRYVMKHMDTLDKYVMIGAPPQEVFIESLTGSLKQFLMSWYVFFFQMPYLPELVLGLNDMKGLKVMKHSTEEELEAYKYTFGKKGAYTAPINYYRMILRSAFTENPLPIPTKYVPGLFMLGENDKYINRCNGKRTEEIYKNLEFKVIEGANHFAQQHKPEETNRMIREFLQKK